MKQKPRTGRPARRPALRNQFWKVCADITLKPGMLEAVEDVASSVVTSDLSIKSLHIPNRRVCLCIT